MSSLRDLPASTWLSPGALVVQRCASGVRDEDDWSFSIAHGLNVRAVVCFSVSVLC